MVDKNLTILEENGEIKLIELNTLSNCLPVSDEIYSRIIYSLMNSGYIKLAEQKEENNA